MSQDVSGILGEYMLKGWVLTDRSCPSSGCNVPLMRSPTGRTPITHFCAKCDGGPEGAKAPVPAAQIATSRSSSDSTFSRSSTPPTEVSSTLSSPVFAPPPETEESRRRREQSDAASAAIGQRLLKGWAMLAVECPNSNCIGVPLVRPPRPGGEKDPRKECVICGIVYVTEVDRHGREQLVPETSLAEESPAKPPVPVAASSGSTATQRLPVRLQTQSTVTTSNPTSLSLALDDSAQGLEATLRSLSGRLGSLSAGYSDPASVGSVADAITKVVQAISQVRQLQWAERQAHEAL